jgi:hypothetical protein
MNFEDPRNRSYKATRAGFPEFRWYTTDDEHNPLISLSHLVSEGIYSRVSFSSRNSSDLFWCPVDSVLRAYRIGRPRMTSLGGSEPSCFGCQYLNSDI